MKILVLVLTIYVLMLVIRRVWTGYCGTWIKKRYFYLETNDGYICKVKCKRIGYLLNPFAKNIIVIIPQIKGMAGRTILKIKKEKFNDDGFNISKFIGYGDEVIYERPDSFSLKPKISRTSFQKFEEWGKMSDMVFLLNYNHRIIFADYGVLKKYEKKQYSNRQIRKNNKRIENGRIY